MNDKDIIKLWRSGLSKNRLAEIYRRQYNQQIRTIRSNIIHRHDGRLLTNYEALNKVEQVIYKYLKQR